MNTRYEFRTRGEAETFRDKYAPGYLVRSWHSDTVMRTVHTLESKVEGSLTTSQYDQIIREAANPDLRSTAPEDTLALSLLEQTEIELTAAYEAAAIASKNVVRAKEEWVRADGELQRLHHMVFQLLTKRGIV